MITQIKSELERVATVVGGTYSYRDISELQDYAQQFDFATGLINVEPLGEYQHDFDDGGAIRYNFRLIIEFWKKFSKDDTTDETKDVIIDEMAILSEDFFRELNKNENQFWINPKWTWRNDIVRQHTSNLLCGVRATIDIDTGCNRVND
jgi:hypothetical protein